MRPLGLALILILTATDTPFAQPPSLSFEGADWIWSSAAPLGNLGSMSAGVGYFRAEVDIPESPALRSAEVAITADNLFVLYVNGRAVGESEANNNAWGKPKRWDLTGLVVPGRTVLAVEAVNTLPGPAGLIVSFVAELSDGRRIVLGSGTAWKASPSQAANWQQPEFDDQKWPAAAVVGNYGAPPWGRVTVPAVARPGGEPVGKVQKAAMDALEQAVAHGQIMAVAEAPPPENFSWPAGIVFVGDDCSLERPYSHTNTSADSLSVTIFNPRKSRAFPEHDLPAPMKIGRKLYALAPARPGAKPRVLADAGRGALGSPSVSFDGRSIYVSMAYDGEPFFHIYRVPAEGGSPRRLTDGPFHDIDPAELPDGRLVFTSTRIGRFEEYHNPPSRSLFVMNADGRDLCPLTHTIIFDNEPEVMADGRILFIRSDNFFDRGKVETLLHAIHPDGARGYTEFGLDQGPEYGGRLRAYLCGSPAPMPDGRVAFVSGAGITVGRPGHPAGHLEHFGLEAGDVAALPDGRLICTTPHRVPVEITVGKEKRTVQDLRYEKLGVIDPEAVPPSLVIIYESPDAPLHSPVFLGLRPRPPVLAQNDGRARTFDPGATGVLYCQNARLTKNHTAGWPHVRAIRVLAGTGLTTRSSHSYIVHAGNETIELGTVPLAADGSFAVEVPADTPIALQAVDAEGRSELNEMSWIYVRAGERRGCVGCHHKRQDAPICETAMPLALQTTPLLMVGEGRPHRFRGNNAAVTGLMELQFDRYREVAGIDRHGDLPDPVATGADEVATLIAQLRGADRTLHVSAAQRLGIFRDPVAAPALADRLKEGWRETRVAAAVALAACGTRDSIAPLLDALDDSDPIVAESAAVALENLTGHSEPFDAFADGESRRQQSHGWREWITSHSWQDIEAELIRRLQAPDRDVVRRAAVALGHTGGDAAVVALAEYLVEHRGDNPFPEWQKTHRGDGARFNALSEVNPRTIQAVTRALGYLKAEAAVSLLAETLAQHSDPATGNLFLAEAAAEALGRIGTPAAEAALIDGFSKLKDYPLYTSWYGDHSALMACHASPIHYFILEALDRLGSTGAESLLPHMIRSLPVDPDRALLLPNDDYETLVGRILRRHDAQKAVVETCLAILGDPQATKAASIEEALSTVHRCWGGHPCPENRAAQVLSLVCRDPRHQPRVLAAFDRYRAKATEIPRVFDTGIPVVLELPVKNWVCFFLARTLGNLGDSRSVTPLIAALSQSLPEAAGGRPDPLGPGVLFLHNDLTPCWRAAVAWALGRLGDRRAVPTLLDVARNLKNATDTRHAAAEALERIADPASRETIRQLAADYPELSTRRALEEAADACRHEEQVASGQSP